MDFISVISLNVDEETIFLYPFTESREINNISEVVRLDSSAQKYIAERRIKSGDWVRVVGRFHKRDPEGEWQLHLGVVADLVLVSPRERGNLPHEKKMMSFNSLRWASGFGDIFCGACRHTANGLP